MTIALTILAIAATALAAAVENTDFTLNVLLKRQESTSGAQYQCHSDCGYIILDASSDNCNNSTWTDLLSNCEECAATYNILRYYGDQVRAAAEDCSLTAAFSPSAGASSGPAPVATSPAVSSALSLSDIIIAAAETASQVEAPNSISTTISSLGPAATTAAASGTIVPSPSSNSTSIATQSAVPTGQEEFAGAGVKLGSHAGATIISAFVVLQCLLR